MLIKIKSLVRFYWQLSEPIYFTVFHNQFVFQISIKKCYKTFVKAHLILLPNIFKIEDTLFWIMMKQMMHDRDLNCRQWYVSCRFTMILTNILNFYLSEIFVVVTLIQEIFSPLYLSRMVSSMISIEL